MGQYAKTSFVSACPSYIHVSFTRKVSVLVASSTAAVVLRVSYVAVFDKPRCSYVHQVKPHSPPPVLLHVQALFSPDVLVPMKRLCKMSGRVINSADPY